MHVEPQPPSEGTPEEPDAAVRFEDEPLDFLAVLERLGDEAPP